MQLRRNRLIVLELLPWPLVGIDLCRRTKFARALATLIRRRVYYPARLAANLATFASARSLRLCTARGRAMAARPPHPARVYEQRGPLKRRHVFALAQQSIGKEADNIEENEFIGEDSGPPDYGVVQHDRITLANAVFNIQRRYDISDHRLLEEAKVSHHTLAGLRDGKRIADASLMKLFRAAEALRQEADPVAAAMDKALNDLRRLRYHVGGRNKLAKLLGVTGPYLGRVLCGEKPMTEELVERLTQSRDKIATAAGQ